MLRVCGLSLQYPNGKLALTDFGLKVEAGEFVVVLGGNGSGKSTLLGTINGLVPHFTGGTLAGWHARRARTRRTCEHARYAT